MSASDGNVVGTLKIVDNGPDEYRWNLVIIGDGYRSSELSQYHTDVDNFLTTLSATPPFDELFCAINVHRIDVTSTDSGTDDPTECGGTGSTPRTYFDSKFCSKGPGGDRIDRLLTIDQGLALSIANTQVPRKHQVLCLVNSSKYGGSGGTTVATASTHALSSDIAIHEIGHSAFLLADEYGGDGKGTPEGEPLDPNVTRDTNRDTNKWRTFIDATTPMPTQCDASCAESACVPPAAPAPPNVVGTYEGAIFSNCNTYRPYPSCFMRDYSPFCPVCTAVIRQTLQPFLFGYAPVFEGMQGHSEMSKIICSIRSFYYRLQIMFIQISLAFPFGGNSVWKRNRIKELRFLISHCLEGNSDPCIKL